jgi:N-acetylmuramoyl-L-alanine amidase
MNKLFLSLTPSYALVLVGLIMISAVTNHAITAMSETMPQRIRHTLIIDPGHGGEDGGATSCRGVLESAINLEIALRLNDLMHLFGFNTIMIRDTDRSVYIKGETIAQKKVSDLRERVRIINNTENAILVSIHQNTFSDGKYWGAQVFYAETEGSKQLAQQMQKQFQVCIDSNNNRKSKKSTGVYLMENIRCPGILLECGFLSNPKEEAMLRDADYQKALCATITIVFANYLA